VPRGRAGARRACAARSRGPTRANSLKRSAPVQRGEDDRQLSSAARGGPPRGGPPRGPAHIYDSATSRAGSSASSRTSSEIVITGWKRICSRTSSGISSRSPRLRSGHDHVGQAGCVRGERLLLEAADRQHPALECDLAGHPDGVLDRAAREQRHERRRHRHTGARAILGDRARRHVNVERAGSRTPPPGCRVRRRGRERRRARSSRTPSSRRRAARSARGRCHSLSATSSSWPRRTARRRRTPVTARPVATPGTAVRAADSWKNFWRPSASRTTSMSIFTGAFCLPGLGLLGGLLLRRSLSPSCAAPCRARARGCARPLRACSRR
jgi:hypothetical protein